MTNKMNCGNLGKYEKFSKLREVGCNLPRHVVRLMTVTATPMTLTATPMTVTATPMTGTAGEQRGQSRSAGMIKH